MKVGDLVECDGDYGLVTRLPYDFSYSNCAGHSVTVIDVMWSGQKHSSRVDIAALENNMVKVVNGNR